IIKSNASLMLFCVLEDTGKRNKTAQIWHERFNIFNDNVRKKANSVGAILFDPNQDNFWKDSRFIHEDRLHLNSEGHRRVAQAVLARLNLPQQDKSLPTTTIPSTDCHIQIKDVSQYGDRLMIEIARDGGVWILSIGKMEPAEFQACDDGFSFKLYSQDCEEMGCEADWYVRRDLVIGSNFLKAHSTEPYSRKSGTFTCLLD
ncbi:MAG: hypothetical protein EB120_07595, partial [Proteobacteria bacterium]|nr:hypothetical protein [Pseudomonadota bacterium]